jgi:uncharacterized protein (TIGR02466 family)
MYNVTGIFPTPIYSSTVTIPETIKNFADKLEYMDNLYNKRSVISNILDYVEMESIKSQVIMHLNNYCKNIICNENISLRLTQSWFNITKTNESHHKHSHKNSIISGVLYLEPESPSSIIFFKETPSIFQLAKNTQHEYNAEQFSVSTKRGMLLLFPSDLQHSVQVNTANEERLSIAFNTFYSGVLGDEDGLTLLEIK